MRHPILYSLTSNGLTQSWQIEGEDSRFRTHEGIVDGVITTSSWTECLGKNIGRSNETSPVVQAEREVAAKHKKKLESGYHEDIAEIATSKYFECMLAKKWEDYADEIEFPIYSQPKLDGGRAVSTIKGLFSRNGKPILSAPHIVEDMSHHHSIHPKGTWDGELYCHKFKKDFNKIISLIKKTKPTTDDLAESAEHIEYWVYDMVTFPSLPFEQRTKLLKDAVDLQRTLHPNIRIRYVETTLCHTTEELDALYSKYLDEGFEGQMVRTRNGLYENKRSKNLLKRKTFLDGEFELVDLQEGRGNLTGIAARAILKTKEGIQFEAGMIGSHEYCADLLRRKAEVIGQMATVVYQNLTPDKGVPRFGKLKALRFD